MAASSNPWRIPILLPWHFPAFVIFKYPNRTGMLSQMELIWRNFRYIKRRNWTWSHLQYSCHSNLWWHASITGEGKKNLEIKSFKCVLWVLQGFGLSYEQEHTLSSSHWRQGHYNLGSLYQLKSYLPTAFSSGPTIVKFCTEHTKNAPVLCAKFWNDCTPEIDGFVHHYDISIS